MSLWWTHWITSFWKRIAVFLWTLYDLSYCHSDCTAFYKTRVKLFDPNMGQKYLVTHILMSNLVSSWADQFCRAERNDCVLNCFVEPALHRREWELRDKNHRLWLCSPQTTRQSAPEDSLFHPAVRCTRDTQIWWLWWILRPVESGGHSGKWMWDEVEVKTNYL